MRRSLSADNRLKLLLRDPLRRLGSGEDDAEAIKRHPFFRDVNFDDVYNKRIPPPYKPTIVSDLYGGVESFARAYFLNASHYLIG